MKTLGMAVVLLTAGAVVAQDDVKAKIEQYLKDLGSESYEAREKASTELKKIGPGAVEALKKAAAESPDAEVRTRATQLIQEIEKGASKPAEKAKPGRGVPPGPGMRGASVAVQSVNGNSTYTITPAGGQPFTFHKNADGTVSLDYTDGDGKEQTAKADSLEAFLKDQKDLAASYGISKDGIDYGGTVISFDGKNMVQGLKGFRIWKGVPFKKGGDEDEDEDGLEEMFGADFPFNSPAKKVAGAAWEPVSETLRSQLEIAEGQGLVVKSVGEDTVASRAGLKKHDIVLEIDGTKVTKAAQVKELLKKESKSLVIRGGKRLTLGEK